MSRQDNPGGLRLDEYDVKLRDVDPRLTRRLLAFLRPYLGHLALGGLLMLVTALTGLVGPYLVKLSIDTYIRERNAADLNWVAAAYLLAASANWWSSFGQTYVVSQVGQRVIYDLRSQLFQHLQALSFRFYDTMATGRIMSRIMSDVDAINQLVTSGLVSLFADSILLAAIVLTMLQMNARLALVSFLTVPVLLAVLGWFKRRLRASFMEMRRKAADLNANLAESISGVRVTQSFTREEANWESFNQINERNRQAGMDAIAVWGLFFPSIEVVAAFGTTLVLWYGGLLIKGGEPGVTVGQVAAFILYLNRFFSPVRDLSQVWNIVQAAMVSAERVLEVLNQEPEVADIPGAPDLPRVRGHVRFEAVTFGYTPGNPVLHGIDLEAQPGETIALVGPTGAGKSSIINLLGRFYDPEAGQVLVDGHNLSQVSQRSWRTQLGVVQQDTFLFSGTIRENIRYGRPLAADSEVEAAARAVGAHEFIQRMSEGYETQVRERGSKLSVGQRQLIAFARALCADPAILILDEATSNVDTATEQLIQQAMQRLLRGRTSFVVAHRLSTIRSADRIYVIEDGRVAEAGTHEELMGLGGRYAELCLAQVAPGNQPGP